MKKITNAFVVILTCLFFTSCDKKDNEQQDSLNNVQFEVPAQMEITYGSDAISFRVQFGKKPSSGDQIVLGTLPACPITQITTSSFTVNISSLWNASLASGTYTVSIKRGNVSQNRGEMQLVVKADDPSLEPAEGSTVYGKVTCEGNGIPNVSVSDGVEVVRTDKDGVYQLKSKKYHKYVFVSVPSGYEPYAQDILPIIHAQLSKAANVAERVDFQLQKVSGQENHTMLMLGDMHLAGRYKKSGEPDDVGQFKKFVQDINAYVESAGSNVYALTLGDMTWDLYWLTRTYGYKEYLMDARGIKNLTVYHTIGNHDHSMYEIGDYNTVAEYKKVIAPTYYSFNIGNVHYVVLDDVKCTNSTPTTDDNGKACYVRDYDGTLVQEQLDWLAKDLSYVDKNTPLVVTMHIPLYNANGGNRMSNASQLADVLKAYSQVQVYTAHTHTIYNVDKTSSNHIFEHNAGAICGTWWWTDKETPGIHIGQDGSPGGYTVVKVNGTSFSWQFKATGHELDHQFRTYDRNNIALSVTGFDTDFWANSSSANEVYINVWNYDPSWKVEVTENGNALSVSKVTALDPLHVIAYTAPRLNKGKSAGFSTTKNSHMFKVKASSDKSPLVIKVTDRFGNVYTETMERPKAFNADAYK